MIHSSKSSGSRQEAAQMPYAVNEGVRIHYQIEGEGEPLVLQHGFTDSLETWYELGYVEALKPQLPRPPTSLRQ
jgi:pimeloyl-ACP methyl ester carboxylesterase